MTGSSFANSCSRRNFLGKMGVGIGAALLPAFSSSGRVQAEENSKPDREADQVALSLHITRQKIVKDGKARLAYLVNGTTPGPLLRFREGQSVSITVHNHLEEPTSLHWHGIRLPAEQDGVPGLSFAGIPAGECFTYHFPLVQSGTYWYHSHVGGQEPAGLFGALIIEPKEDILPRVARDYTLLLSEWTDVSPAQILNNLKMQDDYYNFRQRSLASLPQEARDEGGYAAALKDRLRWSAMRMSATDISDVSGVIYSYLLDGFSTIGEEKIQEANTESTGTEPDKTDSDRINKQEEIWSGLFCPGERVRLRIINAASMTLFDVRLPGLSFEIIEADGNPVKPVMVEEFRIGVGETYALDVTLHEARSYGIFAQSEDRTGYAFGALMPGRTAAKLTKDMKGDILALPVSLPQIPPMDKRPVRTMRDMGMDMSMGSMPMTMPMGRGNMVHTGINHQAHHHQLQRLYAPGAEIDDPGPPPLSVENQMIAGHPVDRTASPGDGLENNGRRVLSYADLCALQPVTDTRLPTREIILHLTGNMERYIWGFNGRKFSESGPIRLKRNERVRFTIINDTMMEHPLHLHGLWSELENGYGNDRPVKHTIISQPGSRMSFLVTADSPGLWAYHCHLAYHMMTGMFRAVLVS